MMVRELEVRYGPGKLKHDNRKPLLCAKHVAKFIEPLFEGEIREKFIAIYLDTRHTMIGVAGEVVDVIYSGSRWLWCGIALY